MKKLLILVALALLLLAPVSAYTEISTTTVTGLTGGYGSTPSVIFIKNATLMGQMGLTRATFETSAATLPLIDGAVLSGSITSKIIVSGCSNKANATIAYTYVNNSAAYSDHILATYTMPDFPVLCPSYTSTSGIEFKRSDGTTALQPSDWGVTGAITNYRTTTTPTGEYDAWYRHTAGNIFNGTVTLFNGTSYTNITADFYGIPANGTAPLNVEFTDISTGAPTSYNWTSSPSAYFTDSLARNTSAYFVTPGNYTITHCAADGITEDCETKIEYITVRNGTAGSYRYPVTIADATNGFAIVGAHLGVTVFSANEWYNRTSASGKFNVTGSGTDGLHNLDAGDVLTLDGVETGYIEDHWELIVSDTNNGEEQFINLFPEGMRPKAGECAIIASTYEEGTTATLSGVTVAMRNGGNSTVKITNSNGAAVFQNLTASITYTLTAQLSGYTPATQAASCADGEIKYISVPMLKTGVFPDPSGTITPTPSGSGGGSGGAGGTNLSAGALNDRASEGIMQMISDSLGLWQLALLLIVLAAMRTALS